MLNQRKNEDRAAALAALHVAQAAWAATWHLISRWRTDHDLDDPTWEESIQIERIMQNVERRIRSR